MKFCKDCRHYGKSDNGTKYDMCNRNPPVIDLVRGEPVAAVYFCTIERDKTYGSLADHCGPDAKFFEPSDA